MIERALNKLINAKLFRGKVIIILGARQTGKTTILKSLESTLDEKNLFLNCDDKDVRKNLENLSTTGVKQLAGNARVILIDEAQRVKDIGIILKILIDNLKGIQIIVTGSSAFELTNEIKEPLTGRKWEYNLYPFSFSEMVNHTSLLEEKRQLKQRLIYGYFPDVVNYPEEEREILTNLIENYLYKDILSFPDIRKPEYIEKLLEIIALQVGFEVSYNELAQLVGIDPTTIKRYIGFLERTYIIFRLHSFSRNVRNELKRSRKIYFYDNGIRNAIISNFHPVELRTDIGAIWENFVISERMKFNEYNLIHCNKYFWRTSQQQEIDYIEDRDGKLHAFEFKWNPKTRTRFSKTFLNAYSQSETAIITPENIEGFILNNDS